MPKIICMYPPYILLIYFYKKGVTIAPAYPTADIYDSRSDRFDDIQWHNKIGICICHNANPHFDIIRPFFPRDDQWGSSKASQRERVRCYCVLQHCAQFRRALLPFS